MYGLLLQCLSAAALWATTASYKHAAESGQGDCSRAKDVISCFSTQDAYLSGLNIIVTVSKAVQTLSLANISSKVQVYVQTVRRARARQAEERPAAQEKI